MRVNIKMIVYREGIVLEVFNAKVDVREHE